MTQNVALVAGASGIIGKALIEELRDRTDWHVRALARRGDKLVQTVLADLTDREGTRAALDAAAASDTTHVFYAAYASGGGLAEEDATNGAMLRNLLDGLENIGARLDRVVLYQGAKIYGVHLGPVRSPFYEDDNPRHLGPNFYQTQEAELIARRAAGRHDWSILRPDVVIGDAAGNAMNIATVIGAYAAICRASGAAFRFPGSEKVYRHVFAQLTDSRALARASLWAAKSPAAAGEAFNYVHEPFRWERVWTRLAIDLELSLGPPLPISLAEHMPLQADLWAKLASEQQIADVPYEKAVGWRFGDFVFGAEFDVVSDMLKIRQAGFTETVDSYNALLDAIRRQQAAGIIPR
ncbi:SDR family oxidoreductase [Novosphingobium pituita]|uniref:SDR family oxidoreductase n=1 Tax=Novosphingobium pituita TaxID=3056842 RepID=A0ABQ6PBM1_9SPHN|nr:SDR family oxidoreductase [Novosphingobium sp. IK01]GMM62584.1 SDR family oxidoreductase [Novosphingobium sp. IK01]GMM62658.1 SDR family oxidoreductase [Novosphingobium sp. IK01]